ncbi:tyrosine recombinase [Aquipuribacter hungaricus]|uniref:Tyrosine recombinase XerC n=3 Tax=Aquipuribacter hungaricus TaxID=545624 RepID=A0ABV7WER9_9MICO
MDGPTPVGSPLPAAGPLPADGLLPADAPAVLARFVDWLRWERGRSPATVRAYRADVTALLRHAAGLGVGDVGGLTTAHVRSWLGAGAAAGWSRATTARRAAAARTFTSWAVRQEVLSTDPAARLATPRRSRHLPRVLDEAEARRLCEAAGAAAGSGPVGARDHALVELLYATGARVGEVVGVDVGDVDRERLALRVTGKGDKERVVPLGLPALRAVDRWLAQGRPALAVDGSPPALFLGARGGRLDQRQAREAVARAARAAGLTDVHPHALRHTAATHVLDGGADLRCVQELLGHATLTTTEIYTHVSQARLLAAYHRAHPRA